MRTLKKIFKIEIDFKSVLERSGFVIYSFGVIYFLLGLYQYAVRSSIDENRFVPFYYSYTLTDIVNFFYKPFLSCRSEVSFCEYLDNKNSTWNEWYLLADDAITYALLVLSITFLIRFALTKKLNPLPWK